MEGREKNMIYNIVDSVKGGCGKTTFSILLSLLIDKFWMGDRANDETGVCLMDMDIQGTSLLYLLEGKTYLDREENEKELCTLNDWIASVEGDKEKVSEYVRKCRFPSLGERQAGERFDVVFCDPRPEQKKRFRSVSNQNYSPEVMYSTYRMGLIDFLDQIGKQTPYSHGHIIFDMPPNSDGYSDAIYDIMLKQDYSVLKKGDLCNLFLMQTMDQGHRQTSLDYFQEIVNSEGFDKFHAIFFVFNDWLNWNKDPGLFHEACVQVKEICKKCGLDDVKCDRIYCVGLNFNEDYYRLCTQTDGIRNAKQPVSLLYVIKDICDVNSVVEDDEETEGMAADGLEPVEKLLKLMG